MRSFYGKKIMAQCAWHNQLASVVNSFTLLHYHGPLQLTGQSSGWMNVSGVRDLMMFFVWNLLTILYSVTISGFLSGSFPNEPLNLFLF